MAALAGCGTAMRVHAGETLQIAVSEYRITPQSVHAGTGVLTIVVHNYGRLSHNLVISHAGVAEASTKPIASGGWAQLDAVLGPGRYLMASSLVSDEALGTYGTLSVAGR